MTGCTTETLRLRGGEIATLIHCPTQKSARGAVLYVHGFADYFFQEHLASHFTEAGFDFYALDLRRYGRSIRPGDVPFFTTDLHEYFEELDVAVQRIKDDGYDQIVVLAHSTGGLITPLWLDERPHAEVKALILNSPWLDLQESWVVRTAGTWVIRAVGRIRPLLPTPKGLGGVYPESVSREMHGEWDFNTEWKPLTPQPVYFGFLAAVRRGQARLHKGLQVQCPILVMHSDKSRLDLKTWSPAAMDADTVLDVEQIERWAPSIGADVTTVTIPGGMHDLFLSKTSARDDAFAQMDAWMNERLRHR